MWPSGLEPQVLGSRRAAEWTITLGLALRHECGALCRPPGASPHPPSLPRPKSDAQCTISGKPQEGLAGPVIPLDSRRIPVVIFWRTFLRALCRASFRSARLPSPFIRTKMRAENPGKGIRNEKRRERNGAQRCGPERPSIVRSRPTHPRLWSRDQHLTRGMFATACLLAHSSTHCPFQRTVKTHTKGCQAKVWQIEN